MNKFSFFGETPLRREIMHNHGSWELLTRTFLALMTRGLKHIMKTFVSLKQAQGKAARQG